MSINAKAYILFIAIIIIIVGFMKRMTTPYYDSATIHPASI